MNVKNPGSNVSLAILIIALVHGCARPSQQDPPASDNVPDEPAAKVDCEDLLGRLRSLRDGEQLCETNDDCTVWHNGEYWDGCPVEVTLDNASKLDAMRSEIETGGCGVKTNQLCPARVILGCGKGRCGTSVRSTHTLSPQQAEMLEQRLRIMGEQAGIVDTGAIPAEPATGVTP